MRCALQILLQIGVYFSHLRLSRLFQTSGDEMSALLLPRLVHPFPTALFASSSSSLLPPIYQSYVRFATTVDVKAPNAAKSSQWYAREGILAGRDLRALPRRSMEAGTALGARLAPRSYTQRAQLDAELDAHVAPKSRIRRRDDRAIEDLDAELDAFARNDVDLIDRLHDDAEDEVGRRVRTWSPERRHGTATDRYRASDADDEPKWVRAKVGRLIRQTANSSAQAVPQDVLDGIANSANGSGAWDILLRPDEIGDFGEDDPLPGSQRYRERERERRKKREKTQKTTTGNTAGVSLLERLG
jgi:hypothetical protein